jgi:hypothetical protein
VPRANLVAVCEGSNLECDWSSLVLILRRFRLAVLRVLFVHTRTLVRTPLEVEYLFCYLIYSTEHSVVFEKLIVGHMAMKFTLIFVSEYKLQRLTRTTEPHELGDWAWG